MTPDMVSASFSLDERLQADTIFVKDLHLSTMLLMNDARYPWIILVPRLNGLREMHDLSENERHVLMNESCEVSEFMLQHFDVEKMNVGALGNIVSQLHLHHVGRNSSDPAWPGPVWGHSPALPYEDEELSNRLNILKLM